MKKIIYVLFLFSLGCKKDIPIVTVVSNVKDTVVIKKDTTVTFIFNGYKVSTNARQLGTDYWLRGTGVMVDLIIQTFQIATPVDNSYAYQHNFINGGWEAATCGDFNNDGLVDVFTPGKGYNGLSFLIYDNKTKIFKDTSLLNDKSIKFLPSVYKTVPVYLNSDNYVDLVLIPSDSYDLPVRILLSDGKGGYDYQTFDIVHSVNSFIGPANVFVTAGDVGDLNGDGLPDLVIAANSFVFTYWGTSGGQYFRKDNYTLKIFEENNITLHWMTHEGMVLPNNIMDEVASFYLKYDFINLSTYKNYPIEEIFVSSYLYSKYNLKNFNTFSFRYNYDNNYKKKKYTQIYNDTLKKPLILSLKPVARKNEDPLRILIRQNNY
jgi:hypothetical protein